MASRPARSTISSPRWASTRGISKREVSRICAGLDDEMAAFRHRRLDHVEFPYVFVDATYLKGRVGGQVVSRAVVVATGVTDDRRPRSARLSPSVTPRDESVLDRVLRGRCAPRPARRASGDLRSPPRPQARHRQVLPRCRVAALPRALHAQRVGQGPRGRRRDGRRRHPHDLRSTRRRRTSPPSSTASSPCSAASSPTSTAMLTRRPRRPAAPSPRSRSSTGARSGRTTRSNGSTGRSSDAPTSWGCSPTTPPIDRLVTAVLVEQHDEWAVADRHYLSEDLHGPSTPRHADTGYPTRTQATRELNTYNRPRRRSRLHYTTPRDVIFWRVRGGSTRACSGVMFCTRSAYLRRVADRQIWRGLSSGEAIPRQITNPSFESFVVPRWLGISFVVVGLLVFGAALVLFACRGYDSRSFRGKSQRHTRLRVPPETPKRGSVSGCNRVTVPHRLGRDCRRDLVSR